MYLRSKTFYNFIQNKMKNFKKITFREVNILEDDHCIFIDKIWDEYIEKII